MKGHYTIRSGGRIIGQADNLLTDAATRVLLRFLAGDAESWAGAIAVGASEEAPDVADQHLGFEFGRGAVTVRAPSLLDNSVVVKATIPNEIEGEIHELGVFSATNGTESGQDLLLITDFDPDTMDTVNVAPAESRVGRIASLVETTGTGTTVGEFNNLLYDISVLGPEDRLVLAYDADGIDTIEVRLVNAPNDYVYYSFPAQAGYNVQAWDITELSSSGNGSILNTFSAIEVHATGAGGAGTLILDGLRADDTDVFEEQVLVSRAVLPEPVPKSLTTDLEIEYTIRFEF